MLETCIELLITNMEYDAEREEEAAAFSFLSYRFRPIGSWP